MSDSTEEGAWPPRLLYPPPDITPAEFEAWIAALYEAASAGLDHYKVTIHDRIEGVDGDYDFDATIRFEWAGMSFLVIAEAKRHKNPVKRELVQVLHSKIQSVGGHKGAMFSTAGFQRGALEFAKVHGIALVTVTEGRFTIESKSLEKPPPPSREAATEWGVPIYVGRCISLGQDPGSYSVTTIDTRNPQFARELLLGLPD